MTLRTPCALCSVNIIYEWALENNCRHRSTCLSLPVPIPQLMVSARVKIKYQMHVPLHLTLGSLWYPEVTVELKNKLHPELM